MLIANTAVADVASGIRGNNNMAAYATAYHAIYIDTVAVLMARNINLTSTNAKQARVLKGFSVTKAVLDRSSILGDQTSTSAAKADVATTNPMGDILVTATHDTESLATHTYGTSFTVTVPNARFGDSVTVTSVSAYNFIWHGAVTANDTVTVTPFNLAASTIDAVEGVVVVLVKKLLG